MANLQHHFAHLYDKILVLTLLCLVSGRVHSQPKGHDPCAASNTSFQHEEVLVYKVYYNWKFVWWPAGEVVFHVKDMADEYHFEARGTSYPSYDSFFRVRDFYKSIVDKHTMRPKEFVRHVEEGDYRKFDSLAFDQPSDRVYSLNGKSKDVAHWKEFKIEPCFLDLLSVMYKLRNENVNNYQPGDYLDLEMFFDEEVFPIHVIYEEKEEKKIKDLGKFNTIRIKPELIVGNIFKEGDVMKIWVSDDENKVPLMIESPISIGSVKAVLKSYKNLRHPLSSKL